MLTESQRLARIRRADEIKRTTVLQDGLGLAIGPGDKTATAFVVAGWLVRPYCYIPAVAQKETTSPGGTT